MGVLFIPFCASMGTLEEWKDGMTDFSMEKPLSAGKVKINKAS